MTKPSLPPPTAADVARAKDAALHELRQTVAALVMDYGHVLGTWHEFGAEEEVAHCRRCRKAAYINLVRPPHFEGSAVSQPCPRPDAFLAQQHESLTRETK